MEAAKSKFHELFDLLDSDIYTDAPEYAERVARIKALLAPVKFDVETLAEYLKESHADETAAGMDHMGDGPANCSYCTAIERITGENPGGEDDEEV